MRILNTSERVASTNNPNNRPPKKGIGRTIVAIALAIGFLSFTVIPSIALFYGLITGDQYVEITANFYEFGYKVIENGTKIIPSIIPAR